MILPVPPTRSEQDYIVEQIESRICPLESIITNLQSEIDLLREYQKRFIADVVIGKLDVREAAAQLPEEAELEETEINTEWGDGIENSEEEDVG